MPLAAQRHDFGSQEMRGGSGTTGRVSGYYEMRQVAKKAEENRGMGVGGGGGWGATCIARNHQISGLPSMRLLLKRERTIFESTTIKPPQEKRDDENDGLCSGRTLTADTLADMWSMREFNSVRSFVGMLGSESLSDSPSGLQTKTCVFSIVKSALSDTSKPPGVPMARTVAVEAATSALGLAILVCLMFRYSEQPVRTW